ncbi:unnamed protein product [Xylocopa violacea]|uniref:MORN repeat-containing protein 3 n=1 Tax=Xylocopa violacea TaxID=135666 RepID=A0ABP1P218_XYLVO
MPFLKEIKDSYIKRQIESSKRNGLRHAIFSPKTRRIFKGHYIGVWKNDVKEGSGKEISRNGWMYDGNWLNGKKHGCGILSKISKEDHTIRRYYIGEWVAGKKQGFGHNWFEDGSYYEGDFCRNKRHGYGHMWHCNGDYYEGGWKDDFYHGMGLFIKDNGNRYEGQFIKGKKEGYGTYYHMVSGQEQRGLWNNDHFINGIMLDADFRQFALRPTSYPIPQMKLVMYVESSQDACEIINDNNPATEQVSFDRSCKKPPKRTIPNTCMPINTCPCLQSVL